ncbi:MFS general substrate transporter [Myriangium duriaei CBS 260.36]|uniref:MFS general substrate transporter n=1 Tax=Myriangium duriaei CBS 260.36 TaxID=1168546 RepID=A0A9P4J7B1_9PEZI|nr:MFS general substrate transporter [Myriangium duriaei CBS 260.36]
MKSFSPYAGRATATRNGFPTQQMFVLALCRICEPIAFMSIFPYAYYMVDYFKIANNERSIAMYVGMITSSYAFAEFSTSIFWGRVSDRFGRKPVLLMGLFGTGISMLVFGLAPNFWTALVARALGGLLNGNIGVINTTVAEIVTEKKHQARAFSIMPGIWCIGSIIGAGLGGTLADPVRNYPSYFASGGVFDKYPYLLPNLVCCCVVIFSVLVGILFLEETHEEMKYRRDPGLKLGAWLLGLGQEKIYDEKTAMLNGEYTVLRDSDERESSDSSSIESSPALLPMDAGEIADLLEPHLLESGDRSYNQGISGAFTKQVIIVIVSYGILAFHTISAEQLLPVMLSLPRTSRPVHLPFMFTSGFELSTKTIGIILSGQGVVQTVALLVIFPLVSRTVGHLATYRLAVLTYPIFYLLVPYISVLPESFRLPVLYIMIIWKVTAQAFALPVIHILLANSAPSKTVLGMLNGTAASSASLSRGFGPTLSGIIQSAGLSLGCLGLPWWTSGAIAIVAAVLSLFISDGSSAPAPPALPCFETVEQLNGMPAFEPVLIDDIKDTDIIVSLALDD